MMATHQKQELETLTTLQKQHLEQLAAMHTAVRKMHEEREVKDLASLKKNTGQ